VVNLSRSILTPPQSGCINISKSSGNPSKKYAFLKRFFFSFPHHLRLRPIFVATDLIFARGVSGSLIMDEIVPIFRCALF